MVDQKSPGADRLRVRISGYRSLRELWSLLRTAHRLRKMVEVHGFEPVADTLKAAADRPDSRVTVRIGEVPVSTVTRDEALAALKAVFEDLDSTGRAGDEWAYEWIHETWPQLVPRAVRIAVGDENAAEGQ